MQDEAWERLRSAPLFLDGTEARLELSRDQVELFYEPLAEKLLAASSPDSRLLVAVAGPPGSGKTAFATTLVGVLDALSGRDIAVAVGLDGWHYTNEYLDSHIVMRHGEAVSLRQIKGAPESFDVQAVHQWLSEVRDRERLTFPVYSRALHEPLPELGQIQESHEIVVMEGNYLLLDEAGWRDLGDAFDIRVFVTAPRGVLVKALRERHLRGGKTADFTERQIRQVDLPNARRVAPAISAADVVVHKAESRRIGRIEWRELG